jgi:hypothetical protein
MAIDVESLIESMTSAAVTAAKGHAEDLKAFIDSHTLLIADGVAAIGTDLAAGNIDADDAQFAFDQIKDEEATELLAISVTLKAAAQDALNAALNVAASVASKALGIVLTV